MHVVSRCYVLNQLGNAMSDPTAFKIRQVPSSVLAALGLYSQSFRILNAVESSVALSNYYIYDEGSRKRNKKGSKQTNKQNVMKNKTNKQKK